MSRCNRVDGTRQKDVVGSKPKRDPMKKIVHSTRKNCAVKPLVYKSGGKVNRYKCCRRRCKVDTRH